MEETYDRISESLDSSKEETLTSVRKYISNINEAIENNNSFASNYIERLHELRKGLQDLEINLIQF